MEETNLLISVTKSGAIVITNKKSGVKVVVVDANNSIMFEVVGEGQIKLGAHGSGIGPPVNAFVQK